MACIENTGLGKASLAEAGECCLSPGTAEMLHRWGQGSRGLRQQPRSRDAGDGDCGTAAFRGRSWSFLFSIAFCKPVSL